MEGPIKSILQLEFENMKDILRRVLRKETPLINAMPFGAGSAWCEITDLWNRMEREIEKVIEIKEYKNGA